MTYLGWGVWTPDTELAHHGIMGMKWGDRNGPPYPLRPGARSGAEKKAGTPIADKFADASRKLKKKAAVSKAKRTRRKKAKYEHDRQEALRKGSADDILKYRGNLSNEEMETAYKRIQWENKLESLSKESRKNGMTKADKLLGNDGTIGKIKEYSGNIAGVMQNINKINKALKGDSGDEKEDKKDKKDKNKDKEKNIVINNYVNGEKVDDSSGSKAKNEQQSGKKTESSQESKPTSEPKSEPDTSDEQETIDKGRSYVERNYTSLNNTESYQNYYKDKEAKESSRNEYGGIDIKRYDRYMRHSMTYLEHTGIKGQKWGSRRFRNYDGKLTPAGKERYYSWDRKQITNQIPDGTFAYNEVDDEVYESVGGRMVAIDHNRPDYEERKAEARRAYETQKEIEEHLKHAYLGWGIYGIVDDRTYLAHHGVKGMHWGIRRYQPYPDGVDGKFIGRRKLQRSLNKLDKSRLKNTYYSNKYSKKISKLSSKNASGKYDKKIAKFSTKKASYDQAIKAGNDLTTKLMDQASAQGMTVETAIKRRSFRTGRDIAINVLSLGMVIAWHEGLGYKYKVKPAEKGFKYDEEYGKGLVNIRSLRRDDERENDRVNGAAIEKRLSELEQSNKRVSEIKKSHTGDGYEYVEKVVNETNDKTLRDAVYKHGSEQQRINQTYENRLQRLNNRINEPHKYDLTDSDYEDRSSGKLNTSGKTKEYQRAKEQDDYQLDFLEATQNDNYSDDEKLSEYKKYLDDPDKYMRTH